MQIPRHIRRVNLSREVIRTPVLAQPRVKSVLHKRAGGVHGLGSAKKLTEVKRHSTHSKETDATLDDDPENTTSRLKT
jgi:hypothetical protein